MTAVPMKVSSISMDHKGGTKSYHITRVVGYRDQSIVIYRWGKTGQFGDVQVEMHHSGYDAEKAFTKKEKAKSAGGYGVVRNSDFDAADMVALRNSLGAPLFSKLGPDAIKHLDPGYDTTGMREAEAPNLDEEGRKLERKGRKADLSGAIAEQKRLDEEKTAAAYKTNPIFGSF